MVNTNKGLDDFEAFDQTLTTSSHTTAREAINHSLNATTWSHRASNISKRWDVPIKDKPSATFTRVASTVAIAASNDEGPTASRSSCSKEWNVNINATEASDLPVSDLNSLVGKIVEHRKCSRGKAKHQNILNVTDSVSEKGTVRVSSSPRFTIKQRLDGSDNSTKRKIQSHTTLSTGFPLLQAPLGTYVSSNGKPKKGTFGVSMPQQQLKNRQCPTSLLAKTNLSQNADDIVDSVTTLSAPPIETFSKHSSNTHHKIIDSKVLPASEQDNTTQLAVMTRDEIKRKQHELDRILSPSLIAYLKQRCNAKKNEAACELDQIVIAEPTEHATQNYELKSTIEDAALSQNHTEARQKEEKERLSALLSSIKTNQDLVDACASQDHEVVTVDDLIADGPRSGDTVVQGQDNLFDVHMELACDLLRSSVRRQNFWASKAIVTRLRDDLDKGKYCSLTETDEDSSLSSVEMLRVPWPYPTLLPVALRCLLDVPLTSSAACLLNSYVLESLYLLLQLRACKAHVVNLFKEDSDTSTHQLFFMDDAVPSPRISTCYFGTAAAPSAFDDLGSANVSVYDSSSQSARADASCFASDPMWTLLSIMKVIPRLASVINCSSGIMSTIASLKAIVSTCGILSMLAQRSPGAAIAIVQHATLLPDLIDRSTLLPCADPICTTCDTVDTSIAIPVIRLLCCLARQSRAAAQGINVESFLYRIISNTSSSSTHEPSDFFQLQQWTLVLWRTLLRYGIALELAPTVWNISTLHLQKVPWINSLASLLLSCLARVALCVRAAYQSLHVQEEVSVPDNTVELFSHVKPLFLSATTYALQHLKRQVVLSPLEDFWSKLYRLRFYGCCLYFLESCVSISFCDVDVHSLNIKEYMHTPISMEDACGDVLSSLVTTVEFRDAAKHAISHLFIDNHIDFPMNEKRDAVSAFFFASVLAFVHQLCNYSDTLHPNGSKPISLQKLQDLLNELLRTTISSAIKDAIRIESNISNISRCRRASQNRVLSSICFILASNRNTWSLSFTRALTLYTLGRLQYGEESRIAILCSFDWLLKPMTAESITESPLSSMLLGELCRTPNARAQLDHSFKLFGEFGITSKGNEPFDLQSLRSEADRKDSSGSIISEFQLDHMWIWQLLSRISPVEEAVSQTTVANTITELPKILSAALQLILDMEISKDEFSKWYTRSQTTGEKLYHVTNVCLLPESVFSSSDKIQITMEQLLDLYTSSKDDWGQTFVFSCKVHSEIKKSSSFSNVHQLPASGVKDGMKKCSLFESFGALIDFVGDLCDAYVEYGAQYSFYTKCIRIFLLPNFPPEVRCLVLQKVRGLAHLLTLEDDDVRVLLPRYLLGGLRSVDKSVRDAPELIDAFCFLYSDSSRFRLATSDCFVQSLAVAVLVRYLATYLIDNSYISPDASGSCQSSCCQRRLSILSQTIRENVLQSTSIFLGSQGSLHDLVNAVFAQCSHRHEDAKSASVNATIESKMNWDEVWTALRALTTNSSLLHS